MLLPTTDLFVQYLRKELRKAVGYPCKCGLSFLKSEYWRIFQMSVAVEKVEYVPLVTRENKH